MESTSVTCGGCNEPLVSTVAKMEAASPVTVLPRKLEVEKPNPTDDEPRMKVPGPLLVSAAYGQAQGPFGSYR